MKVQPFRVKFGNLFASRGFHSLIWKGESHMYIVPALFKEQFCVHSHFSFLVY
jgi:hypothetical protein